MNGRNTNLPLYLATAALGGAVGVLARRNREHARRSQEALARAEAHSLAAHRLREHLMASASHDLKSPLAAIRLLTHLIKREAEQGRVDREELLGRVELIETNVAKMSSLIAELLDVARLQGGRPIELHPEETDLVALARKIASSSHLSSGEQPVLVEADVPRLTGRWDAGRLERVLTNLVSNGIKYGPPRGQVTIRLASEDDMAVVSVVDRGCGIPAEGLPHIFEWFYRGGNVAQLAGSGVGMASAKLIVEQHGGTIDVDSRVGEGTTVTLRLPMRSTHQREDVRPESATPAAVEPPSPGPG